MTATMIALIILLSSLAVALGLALRAKMRRRREDAQRRHAPHAPGAGRDRAAMTRSALEGHAGQR